MRGAQRPPVWLAILLWKTDLGKWPNPELIPQGLRRVLCVVG